MRDDIPEDRKDEYIDFLHDRIQFLEQELKESEQTVLELRQQQNQDSDINITQILNNHGIEPSEAEDLAREDFEEFEDEMLHTPEEILQDKEKAFEELIHAAKQLNQEEDRLRNVKTATERMQNNIDDWFNTE
jgi:vacuolar-type H+-ATPase subunit H